jgi:hypothetical protein
MNSIRNPSALLAAVLLAAAAAAFAGDEPQPSAGPLRNEPDQGREERRKAESGEREGNTRERRQRAREEWQKRQEAFRNMTPEQRAAKREEFKVRLEKRLAELRQKQTNETITAEENRELRRREQILKRFQQADGAPGPDHRGPPKRRKEDAQPVP